MRSRKRSIFNALTLLSLFLYVATIVLWTRSYSGNQMSADFNPVLPFDKGDGDAFHVLSKEKGMWLEANSYHGDLFFLRFSNFTVIDHGPNTDDPRTEFTQADLLNMEIPRTRFEFQWRDKSYFVNVREDERSIISWIPLPQGAYNRDLSFRYFDVPLRGIAGFLMWNHSRPLTVLCPPEMLPRSQLLILPHWLFGILFAVLPFFRASHWLFIRHRRRRRNHNQLCQNCGYDLRATPKQCPECGVKSLAANSSIH